MMENGNMEFVVGSSGTILLHPKNSTMYGRIVYHTTQNYSNVATSPCARHDASSMTNARLHLDFKKLLNKSIRPYAQHFP